MIPLFENRKEKKNVLLESMNRGDEQTTDSEYHLEAC